MSNNLRGNQHRAASLRNLALLSFLALFLGAAGFKPFTHIEGGCPECPIRGYDMMRLRDGSRISVNLLSDLDDFYIVERFGEFRRVPKELVRGFDRPRNPRPLNELDVVITNANDYVVAGRIVRDIPGERLIIKAWKTSNRNINSIVIYYSRIVEAWKGDELHFRAE